MDATSAGGLPSDLVRVCTGGVAPDDVLAAALPVLLEMAGSQAAVVVRRVGEGHVIAAQAGRVLGLDGLIPGGPVGDSPGCLTEVSVPQGWAARGISRVVTCRLSGDAGTVFLAWGLEERSPTPCLEMALATIDATLARLQAQEHLLDLTARVDNAQQLANMGDYDWHIASDTNRWSDQLYRIYGHEPQSFNASYEQFLAHIHPDDRERITGVHQHAYATGEPYQMIERIIRPDGAVRFLSSNGQVIRDAGGTPVRMRGTCIDITDRVQAEQAREGIAARFRSLVESCPDAILVLDRDARIVQGNGQAEDLLGGEPVGHGIREILAWPAEATDQGIHAVGLDGRDLRVDVAVAGLGQLNDEGEFVAAFLRDATPRLTGEAHAATLREAQVRRRQALEVNDDVVQGLTAAVLCMQQGNLTASTTYLERTLSAARRMMNDWLSPLDGEELQPGALVRAVPSTLDNEPATHRAPCPSACPSPGDAAGQHRILVVDDNKDVRTLLRTQLQSIGVYDVIGEAADGEEAVHMASALQPEIVILDLSMPRMDGLQALPLILGAVPDVRVIVLSGFGREGIAKKALALGAARFVEKGLRMDLANVIQQVLRVGDPAEN